MKPARTQNQTSRLNSQVSDGLERLQFNDLKAWKYLNHCNLSDALAVGRILVSDICHSPANLVLRTSVGFENPTYRLRAITA